MSTHEALLLTVAVTTVCWVVTALLGPQTDRDVLIEFYRKVRPGGPGWAADPRGGRPVRCPAGRQGDNIPLALLGWVAGCVMIWSALFAVGNYLYGRIGMAVFLFIVFVATAAAVLGIMRTLWPAGSETDAT